MKQTFSINLRGTNMEFKFHITLKTSNHWLHASDLLPKHKNWFILMEIIVLGTDKSWKKCFHFLIKKFMNIFGVFRSNSFTFSLNCYNEKLRYLRNVPDNIWFREITESCLKDNTQAFSFIMYADLFIYFSIWVF